MGETPTVSIQLKNRNQAVDNDRRTHHHAGENVLHMGFARGCSKEEKKLNELKEYTQLRELVSAVR
jgi:hypothetical protein